MLVHLTILAKFDFSPVVGLLKQHSKGYLFSLVSSVVDLYTLTPNQLYNCRLSGEKVWMLLELNPVVQLFENAIILIFS